MQKAEGCKAAGDALRLTFPGQREGESLGSDGHVFKHNVLRPPVVEIMIAGVMIFAADMACFHKHDAVRLRKWIRAEQEGVNGAENRRVGPDSQGEGQHRDHREARIPP